MGRDQHGPAYPDGDSYECPVCGVRDRDEYLRCWFAGCPDGHDQPLRRRPGYMLRLPPKPSQGWAVALVGYATFLSILIWLWVSSGLRGL